MSETHYCADCRAAVLLSDAEGHAEKCPASLRSRLDATNDYLNDICDAWDAWKNVVDHGPGVGISDPAYPGPTDDEIEAHEEEVSALWHSVQDAIEAACVAREVEGETYKYLPLGGDDD